MDVLYLTGCAYEHSFSQHAINRALEDKGGKAGRDVDDFSEEAILQEPVNR